MFSGSSLSIDLSKKLLQLRKSCSNLFKCQKIGSELNALGSSSTVSGNCYVELFDQLFVCKITAKCEQSVAITYAIDAWSDGCISTCVVD